MPKTQKQAQEKKYPGFYSCPYHDELTNWLDNQPETVCAKCFGKLSVHRIQTIAALIKAVTELQSDNYFLFERISDLEAKIKQLVDGI